MTPDAGEPGEGVRQKPDVEEAGEPSQSDIDAGRAPATTTKQLVSALRQDFTGMGAAVSTLERLLDKDETTMFQIEQWVDRLAVHLRRADAKTTLAIAAYSDSAAAESLVALLRPRAKALGLRQGWLYDALVARIDEAIAAESLVAELTEAEADHLFVARVMRVDCSQFASCQWHGKRLVLKLGVQPKPCPKCGKEVVV